MLTLIFIIDDQIPATCLVISYECVFLQTKHQPQPILRHAGGTQEESSEDKCTSPLQELGATPPSVLTKAETVQEPSTDFIIVCYHCYNIVVYEQSACGESKRENKNKCYKVSVQLM